MGADEADYKANHAAKLPEIVKVKLDFEPEQELELGELAAD